MRVRPVALIAAVLALGVGLASAQSLGDIAARENERREKQKARTGRSAPVITGDTLRGRTASGTVSQPAATDLAAPAATGAKTPAAGQGQAAAKPAEKTAEELSAERQQEWRDRLQQAREQATRLQARIDQLQTALNDLSQNLYGGNRTAQLSQLDQAKADLATTQQQIATLEEEGRRNRYR